MKEQVCAEPHNFQYLLEHLTIGGAIAICAIVVGVCFIAACFFRAI